MSTFFKLEVKDTDLLSCIQSFLQSLLSSGKMDALLVPGHLPMNNNVMPTLISDPEHLNHADPLAPSFPVNAAKIASRLTRQPSGQTIGLVLRPCEIRAFVELIKLKQGTLDDIVLISLDCLGAYTNKDYAAFSKDDPIGATKAFVEHVLDQKQSEKDLMAPACRVCEYPVSGQADIRIGLYGMEWKNQIAVETGTTKGEDVLEALSLEKITEPSARKQVVEKLISERISLRDKMFEETSQATSSIEKLSSYLSRCVNCYNCRVACPVCYCRECVFVTDVFDHDPYQYLKWARHKGEIKMPTDTIFFHLTRMAHIGLTCVGCGQCSNACPNDIPLMELFRTTAHNVQKAFEYEPGRQVEEPIPLSVFEVEEYEDVVGIARHSG